jgi:hypothetical protein
MALIYGSYRRLQTPAVQKWVQTLAATMPKPRALGVFNEGATPSDLVSTQRLLVHAGITAVQRTDQYERHLTALRLAATAVKVLSSSLSGPGRALRLVHGAFALDTASQQQPTEGCTWVKIWIVAPGTFHPEIFNTLFYVRASTRRRDGLPFREKVYPETAGNAGPVAKTGGRSPTLPPQQKEPIGRGV